MRPRPQPRRWSKATWIIADGHDRAGKVWLKKPFASIYMDVPRAALPPGRKRAGQIVVVTFEFPATLATRRRKDK